jgi:CHASE3 domain sensor protein
MKGMFRNWTIGKKLTGAFVLMSVLVAAVGFIGSANVRQLREEANMITTSAREAGRFAVIQVDMLRQIAAEKNYILSGDQKHRNNHERLGQAVASALDAEIKKAKDSGNAKRAASL